jgi:transcriptional regulator with XRE-family HTH domain
MAELIVAGRGGNPVDVLVGHNIRIHRLDRGLSQTQLASHIGVTFQQVQKYENGVNRIGSGRLFEIAEVLGVPISSFFEGAGYSADEPARLSPIAMLAEPYALRLLKAFREIADPELRRLLVEVSEKFAVKLNAPVLRKPREHRRTTRPRRSR